MPEIMIYLKAYSLIMIAAGYILFLHYLLFLLQKSIAKKARKIFWLIPGILIAVNVFLFGIYIIGKIFHLGCGKNNYILYFAIGLFLLITLPNYLVSRKIYE